ncbi:phosphonate metabolism transcriptional regulator PhnF [Musicola paradisiaca]|uniref:Phophonate C-P lyase system transcriptional regulator PhnF, GntR family n=1 Tax=Musicola paradisiaca (strain Ech703) TaxID=579405 RepID=C6CDJ2_MUSP7|nr:phosphonate metabolism transcriptional regulator PhnF [Musicola paradisiaca]ACS85109.1 phophonate C-P lyase system transcriptional regulator PhnF, GntR family [Musicola paradisiaca Ech703]
MDVLSRHPTTRYEAIALQLEEELRSHYRGGDYLPSEQQLAARYDVNRHTLRRAVDELVNQGLVQRRRGVGTLVLMRPYDYPLHAQARFSQNLLEQGSHPTSERLSAQCVLAEAAIAAALGCRDGEEIIHLRTLRRVNGSPVCVIDHYLPELRWWPVLQHFCSGSLHDFLARELHQPLTRRQTRISARQAQARERQLLEIPPQTPVMCIRTLNTCTGSDRVAEYSISLTRADMIELTMEH